jgi:hypothetical protein
MPYPVGSTTPERHYDAVRDRKEPLKSMRNDREIKQSKRQTRSTQDEAAYAPHSLLQHDWTPALATQFSAQTTCDSATTASSS